MGSLKPSKVQGKVVCDRCENARVEEVGSLLVGCDDCDQQLRQW